MRVFVTGTGRCGTATFAAACAHLGNYTSGHETARGPASAASRLEYPDDHVEVDPHLAWLLASLVRKYPDALYVHLWRDPEAVAASWDRRGGGLTSGAPALVNILFASRPPFDSLPPDRRREALLLLWAAVTTTVDAVLQGSGVAWLKVGLHELPGFLPDFWGRIGGRGDLPAAVAAARRVHNASRRPA